ncbi:MAG TPA: isopentenyl phosphate kinase [Thermoplasmata archaeon]|nr:isopentenyl phosphate kinase [Thermoplasmata archaeon]
MAASPGTTPPVIVKLGGSVITRKREVEHLRPKILRRLAEELAACRDIPLIVLHGAGSFGHPGAQRFGLARAPDAAISPAQRARGAAIVAAEVRRLHLAVLRELVRAGVSPGSVPPATHAMNRAGRLETFDPTPFRTVLDSGLTPVSFGDVVPDRAWGWSILSADTMAISLAAAFRVERVLFVSDVPGILEPGTQGRPVALPNVTESVVEGLRPRGGTPDVTGGIRGKAEAMLAIARLGADAGLISGLKDGELSRAVRGESVYGSWAHGRPSDGPGSNRT